MSEFGRSNDSKKTLKFRSITVFVIKCEVSIMLVCFKKTNIERRKLDEGSIKELKDWAEHHHYTCDVKEANHPIYIRGHCAYDTHEYESIIQMLFSR